MPYIEKVTDREVIEGKLEDIAIRARVEPTYCPDIEDIAGILRGVPSGKVKGAFNYFVTRLWMRTFLPDVKKAGYTQLSNDLGVFADMDHHLRCALMEPYEKYARLKNGDVPELASFRDHINSLTMEEAVKFLDIFGEK